MPRNVRPRNVRVVLELFVQGQSPQSNAAIERVQRVCEAHLHGHYRLDVIDIQQQPERTRRANVFAAPALIRLQPEPVVRLIGRISPGRVMEALGLATRADEAEDV